MTRSSGVQNWAALLTIGAIWGSSFILMKKGLVVFSDVEVAALRMSIAWAVTMPFFLSSLKSISKRQWALLLAVGLLGNGIPAFLFTAAQTHLNSSVVGMLNSLVPVLTLTIGALMFGVPVKRNQFLGITIGLCGAFLLIMPNGISGFHWSALLVVAASSCYALNLNIVRKYLQGVPTMTITAGAFLWIGPACAGYLLLSDMPQKLTAPDATMALSAIVLLAVVGTALAVLLFNSLIQRAGAVFASTVTYVVPVFAVMWGVVDGEHLQLAHALGIGTVLIGVNIMNKSQKADI